MMMNMFVPHLADQPSIKAIQYNFEPSSKLAKVSIIASDVFGLNLESLFRSLVNASPEDTITKVDISHDNSSQPIMSWTMDDYGRLLQSVS